MAERIPLLEYSPDKQAVIMPGHDDVYEPFPSKAAFAFLGDEVERYCLEQNARVAGVFRTITKDFPVYILEHRGEEVCVVQAPLGAPAAAQFLDWLAGNGVRRVISSGSCASALASSTRCRFRRECVPGSLPRAAGRGNIFPLCSRIPLHRDRQCRAGSDPGSTEGTRPPLSGSGDLDNGRFFPGNEGKGTPSGRRGMFCRRDGMCRTGSCFGDARPDFRPASVHGGLSGGYRRLRSQRLGQRVSFSRHAAVPGRPVLPGTVNRSFP